MQLTANRRKSRRVRQRKAATMSDYDGLRLCAVCGDRETQHTVCHVCRAQLAIDGSDLHYFAVIFTVNGRQESRVKTARNRGEAEAELQQFYPDMQVDGIYQIY